MRPMTTAATVQSSALRAVPLAYFPMTFGDDVSRIWVTIVNGSCMLSTICETTRARNGSPTRNTIAVAATRVAPAPTREWMSLMS